MKSWTNWKPLNRSEITCIPTRVTGVYAVRISRLSNDDLSDLIYIGFAGKGSGDLKARLIGLVKGLDNPDARKAREQDHCASQEIKKYAPQGLEFSYIACSHPDAVEKAFLLAFLISAGHLPKCNKQV